MLLQILAALGRSRPSWPLHLVLPGTGPLADRAVALGAHVEAVPMPVSLSRLGDWGMSGRGSTALALRLLRAAADLPGYEGRLRAVLSAIGPDVLHTNGFKAHIVGARARRLYRGLVWHVHEYAGSRPMTRRLVRRYARRTSIIVANSESVAADVREVAGRGCPTCASSTTPSISIDSHPRVPSSISTRGPGSIARRPAPCGSGSSRRSADGKDTRRF